MGFSKWINKCRRRVMRSITNSIGNSYKEPQKGSIKAKDVKRVLIVRPNHRLGNQLLLTPIVQEVVKTFPDSEIDLFVKGGVAHPIFQNYHNVKQIIKLPRKPFSNLFKYIAVWFKIKAKKYDLVINGDKDSSSGKLLTQLSRAKLKVFGGINASITDSVDYKHISKHPIYNLRFFLDKIGLPKNEGPMPVLDIKLSEEEIANGKAILNNITQNNKKTICIYTNATGRKCYSESWWESFYNRLLKEYPNYNIIEMLPVENISKINFKAPHFYSKDIREMGAIIRNTAVFLAADNGVMHLASASLTPTVGFFSYTNPEVYGPYGNGSLALQTDKTDIDDWIRAIDGILK